MDRDRHTQRQTERHRNRERNGMWWYEEIEEQSLKLALWQPWVGSVSDFTFLASAYED